MIRVWVVGALAAVASWTIQGWRMSVEIAAVQASHDRLVLEMTAKHSKLLEDNNEKLIKAQRQVAKLGVVTAANRDAVARLRDTPASSCTESSPGTLVSAPERDILGECVQALADLAEKADQHVIDVRRLTAADF